MKKVILSVFALWFVVVTAGYAQEAKKENAKEFPVATKKQYQEMLKRTICFRAGSAMDMGTVVKNGDRVFAWVPAHAAVGSKCTMYLLTGFDEKSGPTFKVISFFDGITAWKRVKQKKAEVTEIKWTGKILRLDEDRDLAVLEIDVTKENRKYLPRSTTFGCLDKAPAKGLPVCALKPASFERYQKKLYRGEVTTGFMTHTDVSVDSWPEPYDEASVESGPGSGGGCVYNLKTGDCLGMITMGKTTERITWFVSARSMRAWAKKKGILFAFDPTVPVPSDAELKKLPIEDPVE